VHHHFVARGCVPDGDPDLDFNESIRVTTVDYDDLLAAVLDGGRRAAGDGNDGGDGPLRDGRAVLAVTQYELRHAVGAEP
jgi:ADP-ribose pyrophosphatase